MIDYPTLRNWPFGDLIQRYDERDAILYALGCGFGFDPADRRQLAFVYEPGLQVVPSFAAVIGTPGMWWQSAGTGVTWQRVLHSEQDLRIFRPLPVAATMTARNRVTHLHDRGAGRGVVAGLVRDLVDAEGRPVAEARRIEILRDDGGFAAATGRHDEPPPRLPPIDAGVGEPDVDVCLPTVAQAALIYRLSGDPNPLHADPDVAAEAGFDRPILHGLCSFGIATHALLRGLLDYAPQRLRRIGVRFTSPVYPGEALRFAIWRGRPGQARFRAWVDARRTVVLDNGIAEFDEP